MDSQGKQIWEYFAGAPNDETPNINRLSGAVALSENRTLLCGTEGVPRQKYPGRIVLLDGRGGVIAERDLFPQGDTVKYSARFDKCFPWGDGVGVLGSASGHGEGGGWLLRLDSNGAVLWERYPIVSSALDVQETADHELFVISRDGALMQDSRIDRVDKDGIVLLTRRLSGHAHFARAPSTGELVMITEKEPDGPTMLLKVNDVFMDIGKPMTLGRFSPRVAFELQDHSTVAFGGAFGGGWNAAVVRIYANSAWEEFPLEPLHISGWFNDAVPTGPREFATVRATLDARPLLTWISIDK